MIIRINIYNVVLGLEYQFVFLSPEGSELIGSAPFGLGYSGKINLLTE